MGGIGLKMVGIDGAGSGLVLNELEKCQPIFKQKKLRHCGHEMNSTRRFRSEEGISGKENQQ